MANVRNATKRGEFSEQPGEQEMVDSIQAENVIEGVKNLVENSLAGGVQNDVGEVMIDVVATEEYLLVADTGGGVPDSNPRDVFKYGSSGSDESSASAFSFGVGAPSARNLLASQMSVFTQYQGDERIGYSESVVGTGWDAVELFDVESWGDVDKRVREDVSFELDDGVTVLLFEDLNRDVAGRVSEIRAGVRNAFHRFLDSSYSETVDAEVRVNGVSVESIGEPSRVQSIVGLEPRRWMGIELSGSDESPVEPPISCEVEVSLLEEDSEEFAGLWVYCNDLCLKAGETDAESGFGRGERFGQNEDVMVVVDLWSCENPQSLPWNQQKSGVVKTPVLEEAFDWVERVGRAYFRASRKTGVQHLVRAFESEGVVETVDHSGRSTVHPRANVKSKDVSEQLAKVRDVIETHARMLVLCPSQVREIVDVPVGVSKREFGDMYEAFVYSLAESESVGYWNTDSGESLDVTQDVFEYVDGVPSFVVESSTVIGEVVHHRGFVDSVKDATMHTPVWSMSLYEHYTAKHSGASNVFEEEVIQSSDGRRCLVHSYFVVSCQQEVSISEDAYEWCLSRLVRSPKVRWEIGSDCVSMEDCAVVSSVDVDADSVRSENNMIVRMARRDSKTPQNRDVEGVVYKQHLYEVVLDALVDGDISSLPSKASIESRQSNTAEGEAPTVSSSEHGSDISGDGHSIGSEERSASTGLLSQLSRLLNTVSKTLYPSSQESYNDNNVGRTLEALLCISENNRGGADYLGDIPFTETLQNRGIELKAVREGGLSDNITLMSMSPTETVMWNELAADKYGTPSEKNGSIGVNSPLKYGEYNSEGLRLMIEDDEEIVVEHKDDGLVASYDVDAVVEKMMKKLDDVVLVFARTLQEENEWFHYHQATLYRGVDVDGLLDVLRSGEIVLEPRLEGVGDVKPHHNHGLRWRTTVREIPALYDEQQVLVDADMMTVQDARNIEKVQQKMQASADD